MFIQLKSKLRFVEKLNSNLNIKNSLQNKKLDENKLNDFINKLYENMNKLQSNMNLMNNKID